MKAARALCIALLAIGALRCASSTSARIVDSWRAPGTVSFVFQKMAVIALNGGPDVRKQIEQQIADETHGRLVPASSVLGSDDMRSVPAMRKKLIDQGFDGVVTMRLIRGGEINPSQSMQGQSLTSYAESVPPGEPTFGAGKILVEAGVYRLADEDPIWRANVEAESLPDRSATLREIIVALRNELRGTGLVHD